jgi:hypothetical protein
VTKTTPHSSDLSLSQLDAFLDVMIERHNEWPHRGIYQPIRVPLETALVPPFPLPPMQDVQGLRTSRRWASAPSLSAWPAALLGESASCIINGHRAIFFAYRARTAPLRARLEGRLLDGQVVYVGMHKGYSIATVEAGAIGFAMTSDLSLIQNASLILSAVSISEQH